jgi:hypothetical protein
MNPELQTVIDRLELVERQNRGWKAVTLAGLALAAVAFALVLPQTRERAPRGDRVRASVVEANQLLLRDPNGTVVGGLEVDSRGTMRLVLGTAKTAAALLEVQSDGLAHLTLRGTDGAVRAALLGGSRPSLALSPEGERSSAAFLTQPDGGGALLLTDALGRVRFRIP